MLYQNLSLRICIQIAIFDMLNFVLGNRLIKRDFGEVYFTSPKQLAHEKERGKPWARFTLHNVICVIDSICLPRYQFETIRVVSLTLNLSLTIICKNLQISVDHHVDLHIAITVY